MPRYQRRRIDAIDWRGFDVGQGGQDAIGHCLTMSIGLAFLAMLTALLLGTAVTAVACTSTRIGNSA